MVTSSLLSLWWLTIVGVVASTEGMFWIGGSDPSSRKAGTERSQQVPPHHYHQAYTYRVEGAPWAQQYTYDAAPPVTVAVPFAVPLTPQMGALRGGVNMKTVSQPVQLVPCLCPISRDDSQYQSPQSQPQQQTYYGVTQQQQQQQQYQQHQQQQQQPQQQSQPPQQTTA